MLHTEIKLNLFHIFSIKKCVQYQARFRAGPGAGHSAASSRAMRGLNSNQSIFFPESEKGINMLQVLGGVLKC